MVELDQFKYTLSTYEKPLQEVRESMNLDAKIRRIDELDKTMEEPSLWEDAETATKMVKESKRLKDTVNEFNKIVNQFEEIGLMIEMGYEENDPEVIPEIEDDSEDFEIKPEVCDGIEACKIALLKKSKNALAANFIEGMACQGGCIGGAGCLTHGPKDKGEVDKYGHEAYEKNISDALALCSWANED